MKNIVLETAKMTSVTQLHTYLHRALALPAHYGANLDALYDCLTEICEPVTVKIPANITSSEYLGLYGEKLLLVFQEAASENKNIHVEII